MNLEEGSIEIIYSEIQREKRRMNRGSGTFETVSKGHWSPDKPGERY